MYSSQTHRKRTIAFAVVILLLVAIGCQANSQSLTTKNPVPTNIINDQAVTPRVLPSATSTEKLSISLAATSLPTQTQTPAKGSSVSRPWPTPRFTKTPIIPTATLWPTATYYDPILGISVSYPATWEQQGYREFKGEDSYLKIVDLPNAHSLSITHVCEDYAYANFPDSTSQIGPFASGCAIIIPEELADRMIGIFRYKSKVGEYHYFLLDTTEPYFKYIALSLVWDEHQTMPNSSVSPNPQPLQFGDQGLEIRETFIEAASFDGEQWNTDHLYINRSDITSDYRSEHCGKSIVVGNNEFTVHDLSSSVVVQRDENTIFTINLSINPFPGVWVFCEWNGSWVLETSDFIIQDGQVLNHEFGYDQMFGWHILAGKPFYFFAQDGAVQISYNGQVLPIQYDYVPHYGCCEAGFGRNPKGNDNNYWFFGVREGIWYLVDIYVE
jgi:hypothetical protein